MGKSSEERTYIAIDLKSFYASVECVVRGLDPLRTNLVVADESRTEKTICLAVSPSLKAYKIPGRARLFEVVEKVREVNAQRRKKAPRGVFSGSSVLSEELERDSSLELSYIVAKPQMALYMKYSTDIYDIYLKYVAPEDMHVYSVDEVFLDVTDYLHAYDNDPERMARIMVRDVLNQTGITATAGIGTNLYLSKIAMDIVAKHAQPDEFGVRIARLDEASYREQLWDHEPLTDFWRVGRGYQERLREHGLMTMGDIARCSIGSEDDYYNEDLLYKIFGVNAELLIDHAWGYEPCRISDIHSYVPENNSLSTGQVLTHPYPYEQAMVVIREMAYELTLSLVEKGLVTDQIVLNVGYDTESAENGEADKQGVEVRRDHYGRRIPKPAHASENMDHYNASARLIYEATKSCCEKCINPNFSVRRISVVANHVIRRSEAQKRMNEAKQFEQLDLFTDYEAKEKEREAALQSENRELRMEQAVLSIKKKFGKNAILRGTDFREGATQRERNGQIGGHKA